MYDTRDAREIMTDYLALRETIDPGATASRYDQAAGTQVLRLPFARLLEQDLIYGGMYTGAMGGGCMMLVVTPHGKERIAAAGGQRRRVDVALEQLRGLKIGESRPFEDLEAYDYAVNARGLQCRMTPRSPA